MENKYINSKVCANCGGMCCKNMGCHIAPSDLKEVSYDYIKSMIMTGTISIDYWEGDPFENGEYIDKAFFLRMRNKGSAVCDPSWGGQCVLLTDKGCPLDFKDRPKGARLLIPKEQGECLSEYDKQTCVQEWYKYNDILSKIWDEYIGNEDVVDQALDGLIDHVLGDLFNKFKEEK